MMGVNNASDVNLYDAPCATFKLPFVCRVNKADIAWQKKLSKRRGRGGKAGRN